MRTLFLFHWAPRVLSIIAILFISVFSLDAFRAGLPLKTQILDWLIHMTPSFVMMAVLVIAWKWENIGGVIFLAVGLAFTPFIFWGNYANNHSIWLSLFIILAVNFPFILVGVLFILSNNTKKKAKEMLKTLEKRDI